MKYINYNVYIKYNQTDTEHMFNLNLAEKPRDLFI